MLWGGLNYWLYAKPDVVNRWLRGVAIGERRLTSRWSWNFKLKRWFARAFWIFHDLVWNVNRVVPES